MVCSLGSGKMAVMARLLAAGSLSENVGEEVGQQKLAALCIQRELNEADEANLLDEEDMHVFGLKPMTDPLNLVCCNACKKPVKASQFSNHAELCRSLSTAKEMMLELDGGVGRRKHRKKERKKSLTAYNNHATSVLEQDRPMFIDASESQLDGHPGVSSSFSLDTKRYPGSINSAILMDGKRVSPDYTDHSGCLMPPPTKRSKHVCSQRLLESNNPEVATGLAKSISIQETFMNVPAPLATKVYYSQKSNHLRSAIAHMYHASSAKGHINNVMNPELLQESVIQLQASSRRSCSNEQVDGLLNKKREPCASKPDHILAQRTEANLDESGGCTSACNFSNQVPMDNILRPQVPPVGLLRSKYLPKAYPFAGNSGQTIGTMQQSSGSVPVL